jgi:flavorubredoxin
MTVELFNDGNHICVAYEDDVNTVGGIQSNQFLVVHDGHAAVIDPGGDLTYAGLYAHLNDMILVKDLDYVIASHQDPDIISSLSKWIVGTDCKVVISRLWQRFIPHLCRTAKACTLDERVIPIPDEGMTIRIGNSPLVAVPAHFLHSEGNFQFYDPVSKILFSGDLGASIINGHDVSKPVDNFERHIPLMKQFHERYMSSNKVCRYWANMARGLDIDWIVPQHGLSFKGKETVNHFIDWVEDLECGIDLMTQDNFRLPKHKDDWV